MPFEIELLVIPLFLSLVHIVGIYGNYYFHRGLEYVRSFAAGFSVAYVFLILLPELTLLSARANIDTALFSLIGFVIFHEAHKSVFKHKSAIVRLRVVDEIHLITVGVYSFLITFFLSEIVREDLVGGVIVGVIVAAHFLLSEISQAQTGSHKKHTYKLPIMIASTFLGGIVVATDIAGAATTATLFALTAGALVYIAIREEIPQKERGKPFYFLIGTLVLISVRMIFFG